MAKESEVKKSGLATASLVLGIVGIALSFIPIINNAAFILGVFAVILGIIPFIKKASRGKAIAGLILGVLAIFITLSLQSEWGNELDKNFGNSTEEVLAEDVNVTLGSFVATTDEYGLTDTKLVVTVKNITDEQKSYSFHIEAVDTEGKRIDDDYVYVNDLSAGQSQDFEAFTYVESDKIEAMKVASFNIIEASSY